VFLSWTFWRICQRDQPTVGSSEVRQLDHPLTVVRRSGCKQTHITKKWFHIGAHDLRVEHSEGTGSNGVSLKPVAPGMAEFWASTGGRMAGYASCWSTCLHFLYLLSLQCLCVIVCELWHCH